MYVDDTSNDHSEEDSADCSWGRNLENKVYFRDKEEDINFESDNDSNNDDSGNYDLFNNYDDKEHEEEIFQELLAEEESNPLPTTHGCIFF